jgi:hypothetical protein
VKKYLTGILPFFTWIDTDPWQQRANHRWTDPPEIVREMIRDYLVSRLKCKLRDRQDGGEWIQAGEESLSTVLILLAGLKLFYRIEKALVNQRKQDRKTRISLATIVATSKQLDPTGTGVAHTTILENAEAYAYYKKYRTTSPKTGKRRNQRVSIDMSEPDVAQDPALAKRRQYYMGWRRAELVDELLRVRAERDRFQEQWLDASDNLLQWQLRALEAEKRPSPLEQRRP